MPPILDRKLRFSDAAYAIEATPKTLRNWLQRGQVEFVFSSIGGGEDPGPASGWREFTVADIAVLAIVRRLVDFGMTVEEASSFANATLIAQARPLLGFKNAPPGALAAAFMPFRLIVWRDPPGGQWHMALKHDQEEFHPAAAYLVLTLAEVLATAIHRAFAGRGDAPVSAPDGGAIAAAEKLILTIQDATDAAGHGMERREAPRPSEGRPSTTTPAETAADPMKDTP